MRFDNFTPGDWAIMIIPALALALLAYQVLAAWRHIRKGGRI